MIVTLFPTYLAMMLSINLIINSGFLEKFLLIFNPLLKIFSIPFEILSLAFIRPISGSASLAILGNILKTYGPDSFNGILASVMQGCTDTTFYIITLYFGCIGIKKIRYSLIVCLCADLIGVISSILIVKLLFA